MKRQSKTQTAAQAATALTGTGGEMRRRLLIMVMVIGLLGGAMTAQPVALAVTKPAANNDGYNLIGNTRAGIGVTNGANNDQVGGSTTQINPQLFPLGFYGGGVPARRPMSSSPATAPCGTFSSSFGMVIPANAPNGGVIGPASPYPWNISASGLAGTVTKVTVTLNHLNHVNPFDIDMMLIGPGGQNAVIMSDVGANLAVSDVTLTLDDAAAAALPTDDFLMNGTFRPTNYDPGGGNEFDDYFPGSPVPFPSGASALSVFNGTNPNGTWSLYVRDDGNGAGSTGYLNGKWSLSITTTNCSAPVANNDGYTAVEDGTLNVPAAGVLSNDTDAEMSALTATLVSAPANAASFTLGADGSFSYTPLANFNGTDSFTYKANDGDSNSNTATVTITVSEVNDVPVPVTDAKRTNVNTTLTFPAADLTANDSPGPANESAQTLTVASVTATANTHGTVSLNNGQITYQPTANYSGAASFNYQVCDNGTTNGQADPKCATGTVNVTVVPTYALTVTRADERNNPICAVGDCSLREALNAAGSDAGNDVITFNIPFGSANCIGTACTITLSSSLSPAADSGNLTTINGNSGANVITLSGNGATQILNIGSGVNLAADNLNFTRGANGASGAIGGAIANSGTLTLTNSSVYNNSAQNGGGLATVSGSTTNLTNVTVSGNSASQFGGGIYNAATITTTNCTITGNSAQFEGGVVTFNNTTFTVRNTIIAGNTASFSPDANGNFTSGGYNLVGNASGANGFNQTGDQTAVNPLLGVLANNGGKTLTHALLTGSPAIDKGKSFGITTDQRGLTRPSNNASLPDAAGGDGADIGAFELQLAPTAATVSISGRVTTMNGRGIMNVRLSLTDSSGQVRTAMTTSFGYYRFDDVEVGETYILSATGKHYTFSQPLQVLNINEETNEVNFIANSEKRLRAF